MNFIDTYQQYIKSSHHYAENIFKACDLLYEASILCNYLNVSLSDLADIAVLIDSNKDFKAQLMQVTNKNELDGLIAEIQISNMEVSE